MHVKNISNMKFNDQTLKKFDIIVMTMHTFDMLKNKCRVIKHMLSYLFHVQRLIIFATMVLHYFVRIHDKVDEEFNIYIRNSIQ